MEIRILTWNLFHGRDAPPDRGLFTWRSRLLRRSERGATHIQVNRDLYREFSALLAGASWDVALLQECPPRWVRPLAAECGAEAHRSLTARNWLLPLTSAIARRNPDLIASWEGGCNAILARGPAAGILERRSLTLRRGPPERRTMALVRLGCGLAAANLHLSQREPLARSELMVAAEAASDWARGSPLLLGGDLNLRGGDPVFAMLAERHASTGPTAPDAIDHLLVRGARVVRLRRWSPGERELREQGLALRLSDHAPVEAVLDLRPD